MAKTAQPPSITKRTSTSKPHRSKSRITPNIFIFKVFTSYRIWDMLDGWFHRALKPLPKFCRSKSRSNPTRHNTPPSNVSITCKPLQETHHPIRSLQAPCPQRVNYILDEHHPVVDYQIPTRTLQPAISNRLHFHFRHAPAQLQSPSIFKQPYFPSLAWRTLIPGQWDNELEFPRSSLNQPVRLNTTFQFSCNDSSLNPGSVDHEENVISRWSNWA